MEIKELSQVKMDHAIYKPFSLTSCGKKLALIGPENYCTLMQPVYTQSKEEYSFTMEIINAPTFRPSALYSEKFNIKKAYKNATVLQRQLIVLDPLYALDFVDTALPEPQINCICSPARDIFNLPVIAVVTNYGACEIRKKILLKRTWDKTLLRINDLWPTIFDQNLPSLEENNENSSKIENVISYVENLHITTCCWSETKNENNSCNLYCSTASGWIVSLAVQTDNAQFNTKINSGLYKINCIKVIAIPKTSDNESFLIVSDMRGVIKLFLDNRNEIMEVLTLWSKQDNMHCMKFAVDICDKTGNIIIATCKAAHFLVFVIDTNGILLNRFTRYVGGVQITGFEMYSPMTYLVATLTGHVELVTITCSDGNMELNGVTINHNMDCNNYHILGLCATSNKVSWIFALYPIAFFDVREKNVCMLSVTILNNTLALDVLKNSETLNIEDFADCASVIRTTIFKNGSIECYTQFNPEPVEISDSFLNRLRIRLIIVESLLLYNRYKQKQKGEIYEIEIHSICNTIKAIVIYKRLNNLLNIGNYSEFQILSGMCLRRELLHYLKDNYNQQFTRIKEIFIPIIEPLLERTEKIFEGKKEKCLYCGEVNDAETGICAAQHKMKRCCISYVQIPLLSGNRCCKHCHEVSLEDKNLLGEILAPKEKLQCSRCNCPLIKASKFLDE